MEGGREGTSWRRELEGRRGERRVGLKGRVEKVGEFEGKKEGWRNGGGRARREG